MTTRVFLRVATFLAVGSAPLWFAASASAQDDAGGQAWTTFKGDNQRTGQAKANITLPLSLLWRYSSVAPARTYNTSPLVLGAPGRQIVYFAAGSNIYAIDSQTGQRLWISPELGGEAIAPLTYLPSDEGDLLLAALTNGDLVTLKSADGGRNWTSNAGARITEAAPLVVETPNGTRILCALNTGKIVAFDDKGQRVPNYEVTLDRFGVAPSASMATSADGQSAFLATSDGRFHGIDVNTGRVLFQQRIGSRTANTPVVANDRAIVAASGNVFAFDPRDGQRRWVFAARGQVIASPAVWQPAEGGAATLILGTRDGFLQALDVQTGTLKWEKEVGGSLTGSPTSLANVVVIGTNNGILLGVNPRNGEIVWQYRLDTERAVELVANTGEVGFEGGAAGPAEVVKQLYGVTAAPAAVDNRLFVLGDNAALYAFTSEPFDADPPRVVEPSIALPDTENQIVGLLVTPENPQLVPGSGPFYFAAIIDDVGSGVDPKSLRVSLDGRALEADRVVFDRASGILSITLVNARRGDTTLADGLKTIAIQGQDYAGNALSFTTSFSVDNTAPRPAAPVAAPEFGGDPGLGNPPAP